MMAITTNSSISVKPCLDLRLHAAGEWDKGLSGTGRIGVFMTSMISKIQSEFR